MSDRSRRIQVIINDILNGDIKCDVSFDSALAFERKMEADYFSHMRRNMDSDVGMMVMQHHQELNDVKILKMLN